MRRRLRLSLLGLLLLLSALLGLTAFLLASEQGLQLLWRQARDYLPPELNIDSLQGRLIGPLVVRGIRYQDPQQRLTLSELELHWTPADLLAGRLTLNRLALSGLTFAQLAPGDETEAAPLQLPDALELPVAVVVEDFSLQQAAFLAEPDAQPIELQRLHLSAAADREKIRVSGLTMRSTLLDIEGATRVQNGRGYVLEGRYDWQLRLPDYPPLNGSTALGGSLQRLSISQTLAAPYNARAEITLDQPLGELRFDARLALQALALPSLQADLPPYTLDAELSASGGLESSRLQASLATRDAMLGRVQLDFDGAFKSGSMLIDAMSLNLPDQDAAAAVSGRVALDQAQPVAELKGNWQGLRWPLQGEPVIESLSGSAVVNGSLDDLSAEIDTVLAGRDLPLGRVQVDFDGGLKNGSLLIDALSLNLPDLDAAAAVSGRVALDQTQPVAELKGNWRGLRWPLQGEPMIESPSGSVAITGTLDDLWAEIDVALAAEGRVQGSVSHRQQRLEAQLDWRNLAWPQDAPRVKSPEGRLRAAGSLQDYRFDLAGQVDVPGQTGGHIGLEGSGGLESVQFKRLDIATLGGRVEGSAQVAWQPALKAQIELKGSGLDPGKLLEGWAGRLGAELQAAVEMRGEQLTAQVSRLNVAGELRGYPLRLQAEGDYGAEGLQLKSASLASGPTRLEASGQVGERLNLDWRVQSEDLASLSPGVAGRVKGSGRLRGTLAAPRVVAVLQGTGLRYTDYALERVELDADLFLDGSADSRVHLDLADGRLTGVKVARLTLDGSGRPSAHVLRLDADTSQGSAELALDGALLEQLWRFQLRQGRLAYPGLSPWTLAAPVDGKLSRDGRQIELSQGCWSSDGAEFCLGGSRSNERLAGAFELKALPVGYFAALLPADIRWESVLSGRGSLVGSLSGDDLQADILLQSSAGGLLSRDVEGEEERLLDFRAGEARLQLERQALQMKVDLPFADAGGVEFAATVPAGKGTLLQRPLSGRLRLLVPDIAVFAKLMPEMERVGGRLEGDARLTGSLSAPGFRGRLVLVDGAAEVIAAGIALSALQVELLGRDDGNIEISAQASSGAGQLRVKGTANLLPAALTAHLEVSGEDFQALDIPEAEVRVSPELKLRLNDKRLAVEGDLRVPYARIKLKALPASAVSASADQVIVQQQNGTADKADRPRRIDARLRLLLGERVTFDGFGLKARFEGNLLLIEQPGQLTTASGEISIPEGRYRAYGQNLTIERGRLLYAGGLVTEPGLDVRAVRRPAPGILVGVQTGGTLKKPEFELFSEPAMSQSEQLSYLVLGQPLQGGTSSDESNAMNRAAIALGLAGGGAVAESLGDQLGFDSVGIEKGEGEVTEEASLVVGKFLSPKLYVSYGVGLFEPVSTIWLRYTITSNWKLVTESSTRSSGADIYYTIDRGR